MIHPIRDWREIRRTPQALRQTQLQGQAATTTAEQKKSHPHLRRVRLHPSPSPMPRRLPTPGRKLSMTTSASAARFRNRSTSPADFRSAGRRACRGPRTARPRRCAERCRRGVRPGSPLHRNRQRIDRLASTNQGACNGFSAECGDNVGALSDSSDERQVHGNLHLVGIRRAPRSAVFGDHRIERNGAW